MTTPARARRRSIILPAYALRYHLDATRYVSVGVRVDELRPILGGTAKAKAPRVVVACREVDIDRNPVTR